jgi:hypothetical protein
MYAARPPPGSTRQTSTNLEGTASECCRIDSPPELIIDGDTRRADTRSPSIKVFDRTPRIVAYFSRETRQKRALHAQTNPIKPLNHEHLEPKPSISKNPNAIRDSLLVRDSFLDAKCRNSEASRRSSPQLGPACPNENDHAEGSTTERRYSSNPFRMRATNGLKRRFCWEHPSLRSHHPGGCHEF